MRKRGREERGERRLFMHVWTDGWDSMGRMVGTLYNYLGNYKKKQKIFSEQDTT
jgi:hypothetical protein